jgi:hypothetical protein
MCITPWSHVGNVGGYTDTLSHAKSCQIDWIQPARILCVEKETEVGKVKKKICCLQGEIAIRVSMCRIEGLVPAELPELLLMPSPSLSALAGHLRPAHESWPPYNEPKSQDTSKLAPFSPDITMKLANPVWGLKQQMSQPNGPTIAQIDSVSPSNQKGRLVFQDQKL